MSLTHREAVCASTSYEPVHTDVCVHQTVRPCVCVYLVGYASARVCGGRRGSAEPYLLLGSCLGAPAC